MAVRNGTCDIQNTWCSTIMVFICSILVSAEDLADETVKQLEMALEGNVEAAHFVHEIRQECRHVPKGEASTELLIRARVTVYEQVSAQAVPPQPDGSYGAGAGAVYPTDEQQRQHYAKWGRTCRDFDDIFSAKLRDDLMVLAEGGNVIAGHLYATWKPPFEPNVDKFMDLQEWQLNAFRFSYANLQGGEPLGMLAFSESYDHGLFTGQNRALGIALKIAAVHCGLSLTRVRSVVEAAYQLPADSPFWAFTDGAMPFDIKSMAEGLYQEYCQ